MKAIFAIGVLSVALVGCGVEPEFDSTEQDIRRLTPCATVRCAAGTHCVAKGRRAECVADKQECSTDADCRLFDNYCDGCACDALGVGEEAGADLCEADAATGALEETLPQVAFQGLDAGGDGRLGKKKRLSGAAEAALVGYLYEGLKLSKIHGWFTSV